MKTATPLDDALKLWEPLEKLAGKRIETWLSGYEIYIRKGKLTGAHRPKEAHQLGMYLAALRCLNESAAIDKNSAELHRQTIHFNAACKSPQSRPIDGIDTDKLQSAKPR